MQRRRFYAAPAAIGESFIHLSSEESHHLARVLRLREGDEAFVFDGCGREYRCRVTDAGARAARLAIVERCADEVESPLDLTLAQALAKGEKFDLIVRKATELGVRKIAPLVTASADVKLSDERAEKRAERWRRIALEALKQSGGRRLIEIQPVTTLTDFIAAITAHEQAAAPPVLLVFSERGGAAVSEALSNVDHSRRIIALIGPEGGWDTDELDLLAARGARAVTLGPRVLRTETAALVAVSLIQHRLGDLSRELR